MASEREEQVPVGYRTYAVVLTLLWALIGVLGVYWLREPARMASAAQEHGGPPQARQPDFVVAIADAEGKFHFEPRTLEVKAGQAVLVKVVNVGPLSPHDFVIAELGVRIRLLEPGQEELLSFTAPNRPGTYEFICSVPGHAALGMVGQLVVKR